MCQLFHMRLKHHTDHSLRYLKDWTTSVSHTHTHTHDAFVCVDGRKMNYSFCLVSIQVLQRSVKNIKGSNQHKTASSAYRRQKWINTWFTWFHTNFITLMNYYRTVLLVCVSLNEVYLINWTLSTLRCWVVSRFLKEMERLEKKEEAKLFC